MVPVISEVGIGGNNAKKSTSIVGVGGREICGELREHVRVTEPVHTALRIGERGSGHPYGWPLRVGA